MQGQLSSNQVTALKNEHGDVYSITVEDGTGAKHICYVKKPGRKILTGAYANGGKNPLQLNEVIFKSCWIAGSQAIMDDDSMFLGASSKMGEIVEIREASLAKL